MIFILFSLHQCASDFLKNSHLFIVMSLENMSALNLYQKACDINIMLGSYSGLQNVVINGSVLQLEW